MKPIVTKTGIIRIAVFAVIAFVILLILLPFTPSGVQKRNMAKAEAHCVILRQLFSEDPLYAKVQFSSPTDESIWVHGLVQSDAALASLRDAVSQSNPPRPVKYQVMVESLLFEKEKDTTNKGVEHTR
jgi:hypothetical protein